MHIISENGRGFNLGSISRYRNEIFGISIIMIMAFHFSGCFSAHFGDATKGWEGLAALKASAILDYLNYFGSIGVDMFVFLSGMGLCYSFSNNRNVKAFYGRRYRRLLIPYFIVALLYWAFYCFIANNESIVRYFGNVFFYTFVKYGTRTIWFVALMIGLYFIFPVIFRLFENKKTRHSGFVALIIFFCAVPVVMCYVCPELYRNIEIAMTRIPIFVLGCYIARYIKKGIVISPMSSVIIITVGFGTQYYSMNYGLHAYMDRYFAGIFACGLMMFLALFIHFVRDSSRFRKVLIFFGNYSLELYLTHVTLIRVFEYFGRDCYRISNYTILICVAIVLSLGLKRLTEIINEIITKKRK